jgi:hypothetical protein
MYALPVQLEQLTLPMTTLLARTQVVQTRTGVLTTHVAPMAYARTWPPLQQATPVPVMMATTTIPECAENNQLCVLRINMCKIMFAPPAQLDRPMLPVTTLLVETQAVTRLYALRTSTCKIMFVLHVQLDRPMLPVTTLLVETQAVTQLAALRINTFGITYALPVQLE